MAESLQRTKPTTLSDWAAETATLYVQGLVPRSVADSVRASQVLRESCALVAMEAASNPLDYAAICEQAASDTAIRKAIIDGMKETGKFLCQALLGEDKHRRAHAKLAARVVAPGEFEPKAALDRSLIFQSLQSLAEVLSQRTIAAAANVLRSLFKEGNPESGTSTSHRLLAQLPAAAQLGQAIKTADESSTWSAAAGTHADDSARLRSAHASLEHVTTEAAKRLQEISDLLQHVRQPRWSSVTAQENVIQRLSVLTDLQSVQDSLTRVTQAAPWAELHRTLTEKVAQETADARVLGSVSALVSGEKGLRFAATVYRFRAAFRMSQLLERYTMVLLETTVQRSPQEQSEQISRTIRAVHGKDAVSPQPLPDTAKQLKDAYKACRTQFKLMKKLRFELLVSDDTGSESEGTDSKERDDKAELRQTARNALCAATKAHDDAIVLYLAQAQAFNPEALEPDMKELRSLRDMDCYDVHSTSSSNGSSLSLLEGVFGNQPCRLVMVPLHTVSADEARLALQCLRRLRHPHVLPVEAAFSDKHQLYLHSPLPQHGTLESFLLDQSVSGALSALSLRLLGVQLCDALVYLAERGVVHGHINSACVFVDQTEESNGNDPLRAVLGDFSLGPKAAAKAAASAAATPEILTGSPAPLMPLMPATDVYGLARLLYHMHLYPRELPSPTSVDDDGAASDALFDVDDTSLVSPAQLSWAVATPVAAIQSATRADPAARPTARRLRQELACACPLLAADSSALSPVPAGWTHVEAMEEMPGLAGWYVQEEEGVRAGVEALLNGGSGKQCRVDQVWRIECGQLWRTYAAHRRAVAETLLAGGRPSSLLGGDAVLVAGQASVGAELPAAPPLDVDAREARLLFKSPSQEAARTAAVGGFDVHWVHQESRSVQLDTNARFILPEHSAALAGTSKGDGHVRLVLARVTLGRVACQSGTVDKCASQLNVQAHSVLTAAGEIIVADGRCAYPEYLVHATFVDR